jgi:nucleoid-associated protein YgaU
MTRETKIGLLVGLAFIIVIGILLSDHLNTTNDPPAAHIAQVGDNVRQGMTTPGQPSEPPITSAPAVVTPQQPVQTAGELAPRPQPVQVIAINGPAAGSQPPVNIQQTTPPAQVDHGQAQAQATPEQQQQNPQPQPDSDLVIRQATGVLADAARQGGEPLVGISQTPGGPREYTVQPGDTLSQIAQKVYGSSKKANRELIIRANPSLQANPDLIVAGKAYVIPPLENTPAPALVSQNTAQAAGQRIVPSGQPEYWYTVKEGDNLWKISTEQLGSAAAIPAIKELNKEALRGTDIVRVDMKLRLPAKPLASAQ